MDFQVQDWSQKSFHQIQYVEQIQKLWPRWATEHREWASPTSFAATQQNTDPAGFRSLAYLIFPRLLEALDTLSAQFPVGSATGMLFKQSVKASPMFFFIPLQKKRKWVSWNHESQKHTRGSHHPVLVRRWRDQLMLSHLNGNQRWNKRVVPALLTC